MFKVGDRVRAIFNGQSYHQGFINEISMEKGECGVITKTHDSDCYEILLDSGKYTTRRYSENIEVIENLNPQYEIY